MKSEKQEECFYDRTKQREEIPKIILDTGRSKRIIVLAGTSGVGKTSLAQRVLQELPNDYRFVTLNIGKSSVSTIENLKYFNLLYQRIAELAENQKGYHIETAKQFGYSSIQNWLHILWSAIKNYFHIESSSHMIEPLEEHSVSQKKQYIISVLSVNNFIISIQNVQNMDTQSTELFFDILEKAPTSIWMLEYTLTEKGMDDPFYNFINEWNSTGAGYEVYKIEKLDFDLAFNLAPEEAKNSDKRERIKAQYEKSHGNLMTVMVVPKDINDDDDSIKRKVEDLDMDEKYVVYILYLNETPLLESMLISILTKVTSSNEQIAFGDGKAFRVLHKLEQDNIIAKCNERYNLKHDSINVALSQLSASPPLFLAFRALENYYKQATRKIERMDDSLDHLFSLYIRFHDEHLADLFPRLWTFILGIKYPKEIIRKIEQYKDKLLKENKTDINTLYLVARFLTEICIKLQYPQEAQENLDIIYTVRPSQYLVGLQGAIYSLQDTRESWDKINNLIDKSDYGSRLWLSLCLCRLHIMMRSSDSHCSKAYLENLITGVKQRDTSEYGFLLYNRAEFSDNPTDAIKYCEDALNLFKKNQLINIQAEVHISMSMSYAYLGQLNMARKELETAAELSLGAIPETVFLNNKAVIDILDGKVSLKVVNALADAALMDTNPYELLIIKSNWLVGLTLCNRMKQASELALEIEQSNFEVYEYEDFLHILYQDLLFYYSKADEISKAKEYRNKLTLLYKRNGTGKFTKELIQAQLGKKNGDTNYYASFPFRIDFLGFWGIEISRDLENFL